MLKSGNSDQLNDLLRPVKTRLLIKELLYLGGWISFVALGLGFIFVLLSRFVPIPYYKEITLGFIFVAVLSTIVYVIIRRPSTKKAAREADGFGLEERLVTAIDNRNSSSSIAKLQREDTIRLLQKSLPNILVGVKVWPFNRKQLIIYLTTFLLFVGLLLIPNPMDQYIKAKQLEDKKIEEAQDNIEKQQEEIKNNKELAEKKKEELLKKLEDLKKELADSNNIEEQLKEMQKLNKELQGLKEKENSIQDMYQLMNRILADNDLLKKASDALEMEDKQKLQEALEELKNKLASLSEEERQALIEALQKAAQVWQEIAKQLTDEELSELANNLQKAAQMLQNGQNNQTIQALNSSLLQSLNQNLQAGLMSSQLANTISSLQQSQNMLAGSSNPSSNGSSSNQGNSQTSNNGTGTNQNQSNSSGNNSNGNTGSSGNGNGSGPGSGTNGGNGSGGQSSAGGNGGMGQNGQGSGAGLGEGTHLISVPSKRIDSDGTIDTVNGPLGEGDSETRLSGNNNVSTGITLPYEEVFMEYEEIVRESLDKNEIPGDYQDIIRDYFSSIEP